MIIGIIRERKIPTDKRVVFSPSFADKALKQFPELIIKIEPSDVRCFKDEEYINHPRLFITNDLSNCDLLIGIKEVAIESLLPNKQYIFFSHTIKKQNHNRKLLQACLEKNITLMDYETLVDKNDTRLIGFGRYAGIVGAYNTLRAFGLKYELFNLAKAETLQTKEDLIFRLKKQYFPPIKIAVTGNGKVANGIIEVLLGMKVKQVSVDHFLNQKYDCPVFTQLSVVDYYKRIDGLESTKQDFYNTPNEYETNFERFSHVTDVLITGHFFRKGSPVILTQEMLKSTKNQIKVIGDISCDIDNGPIVSTLRTSTISDPFYGYYPAKNKEVEFDHPAAITVMAIDNLPCELPKESSAGFGEVFLSKILPLFFNGDKEYILEKSTIVKEGKLVQRFDYLQDFVDNKE